MAESVGEPLHDTCLETTNLGQLANGVHTYVCGPDCPRPDMLSDRLGYPREVGDAAYTELARLRSAADPERDSRREAYRERERRRAARALDRFMEQWSSAGRVSSSMDVAGERFVEAVGDYVLSRLGEPPSPWCEHGVRPEKCGSCKLQQKSHYDASPAGDCWCTGEIPHPERGMQPGAAAAAHQSPDYVAEARVPADRQRRLSQAHLSGYHEQAFDSDCQRCNPCAGGRCSDPAAHAEGAHDL